MRVDGEDGEVVVLADEVGARHDVPGAVEGDRGHDVAGFWVVVCVHFVVALIEGVGEDHGCGLGVSLAFDTRIGSHGGQRTAYFC